MHGIRWSQQVFRATRFPLVITLMLVVTAATHPVLASNDVSHGDVMVSPDPANGITPDVLDGQVRSMDRIGTSIVVGGSFTRVQLNGGPILNRSFLFAFDVNTGAVSKTFTPSVDAKVESVESADDGQHVFIGGYFGTVNGQTQRRVAKLDVETGALAPGFSVDVDDGERVMDMSIAGDRLFIGGQFSSVGGVDRSRLAAVDVTTGAVAPGVDFDFEGKQNGGSIRIQRMDVSPDGESLVAIGNFLTIDGQSRAQVARFDIGTSTATLDGWATTAFAPQCHPKFDTYMRDVDISPDGSYFIIGTTGAYGGGPGAGVYCDSITRWDMNRQGPGQQPTWREYPGGDTTWSVLSTDAVVYVGGHERWMNNPFAGDHAGEGSVVRQGIAALDPLNGLPFDWHPRRDPRREGVFKFLATGTGLYFGSDSCCIGGERHERLAFFPLAGGATIPAPTAITLPTTMYQLPQTGGGAHLTRRSFDGSSFGSSKSVKTPGVDWTTARGAFFTNGHLYSGGANGDFVRRKFNGTDLGPAQVVDLNGLSASRFPVSNITGMFLSGGLLYYTVSGDSRLFYRYFTHQTPIVGAETFIADSGGIDWSDVQGMTFAEGRIYFSRANGNLYRITFENGAPVAGTEHLVDSSVDWHSRGLFFRG